MTSLPVSYIAVDDNSTNLKVKYGTVTELTKDLWMHFYKKKVIFKQFNVLELSK